MAAAVSAPMPMPAGPVPLIADGSRTTTVYSLIRDQHYTQAINVLLNELSSHTNNRAALSLLGHCYYQLTDYGNAALCYEHLCQYHSEFIEYRFYWAQALYKSGQYDEALLQCAALSSSLSSSAGSSASYTPQLIHQLQQLQAMIHYDRDDLLSSLSILDQCESDDDIMIGKACVAYKQGKYDSALSLFQSMLTTNGYSNELTYSLAVCCYELGQYSQSLKLIGDIIEYNVRQHPELSIGDGNTGSKSPVSSKLLASTYLIEAFNLKCAIEIQLNNLDHARESLSDMPYREEHDIDIITLHNSSIISMELNPSENIKKLNFIISDAEGNFPKQVFHNLLIYYLKYEYYDLCADILAENTHLHYLLEPNTYQYFEAMILIQNNPPEAYRKLSLLSESYLTELRKLTKAIQESRLVNDTEAIKGLLKSYDNTLSHYLPILMAQCKIYWETQHYEQVESLLKANAEYCSESEVFKLNVAHCFFMQEAKYKEAIKYYELIIHKNYNSVLKIMPIILANLCVAYIMVSENEEAEELMRIIEKEEEKENQPSKFYHLCIVNLVIGTLYCSKNNFEFGISRIIKSFDPIHIKLNIDTWYYAKKNLLTVCEYVAKNMLTMKSDLFNDVIQFLNQCEQYGAKIRTRLTSGVGGAGDGSEEATNNIRYEARQLKRLLYQLNEQ